VFTQSLKHHALKILKTTRNRTGAKVNKFVLRHKM
jgi:hypothetical protein